MAGQEATPSPPREPVPQLLSKDKDCERVAAAVLPSSATQSGLLPEAFETYQRHIIEMLESLESRLKDVQESVDRRRSSCSSLELPTRSNSLRRSLSKRASNSLAQQAMEKELGHISRSVNLKRKPERAGSGKSPSSSSPCVRQALFPNMPGSMPPEQSFESVQPAVRPADKVAVSISFTPSRAPSEKSEKEKGGVPEVSPSETFQMHTDSQASKNSVGSHPEAEKTVSKTSSRRKSLEKTQVQRMVTSGNLTEVFKHREKELTAGLGSPESPKTPGNWSGKKTVKSLNSNQQVQETPQEDLEGLREMTEESSDDDATERSESELEENSRWLLFSPLNTAASTWISRVFGLRPLFDVTDKKTWKDLAQKCVSQVYHFLILCALLVSSMVESGLGVLCSTGHLDDWSGHYFLSTNAAISFGAMLVLLSWGGVSHYKETTQSVANSIAELESHCDGKGLAVAWKSWSTVDAVASLTVWVLLVLAKYGVTVWQWSQTPDLKVDYISVFLMVTNLWSISVLTVASYWQVRISHAMALIVSAWVTPFLQNEVRCAELKEDWRQVSGLFRKTSRTFQYCCAAFCFSFVLIVFTALHDFSCGQALFALPNLAIAAALPVMLLIHASTSTACTRLPSLVTLWEPAADCGDDEHDYMDLALYLSLSECGFFLWDTCVTLGLVQKFLYFTVAIAGTIGAQAGAFRFF